MANPTSPTPAPVPPVIAPPVKPPFDWLGFARAHVAWVAGAIALVVVVLFVVTHRGDDAAPAPTSAPVVYNAPVPAPRTRVVTKTVAAACPPVIPGLDQAVASFEATHRASIVAFQKANGLNPDGVIGAATFRAFADSVK